MEPGPEPSSERRSASVAAANASAQVAETSSPSRRTSGAPSRSSWWMASKSNRPTSQSQPQFTGSASTPLRRSTRLREVSIDTRQPTEHDWQVDSTVWRSHGRALKRYGFAVRAPTGQIWTVLPEKYEENGWSG